MTSSLLSHPLISSRYFFPSPCRFAEPFRVDCGDAVLGCWYGRVDPAALTVIHFHGNGETVGDYLEEGFPERFAHLGANLLLAEYRGYGMSTGEANLAAMLADVAKVIAASGAVPARTVLFGRSVGSLFAVQGVSVVPGIAGLILESGLADPLERLLLRLHPRELGATREELAAALERELDQRSRLTAYRGKTLVLHARGDDLVDVSHGERLHAWAGGEKRLHLFERGTHNTILAVNGPDYFRLVGEFLQEVDKATA